MDQVPDDISAAVRAAAAAAKVAGGALAAAADADIERVLRLIGKRLLDRSDPILAANEADTRRAEADGMGPGLLDRLRLDRDRLAAMSHQLDGLAGTPAPPRARVVRELDGDTVVLENRRPVGVLGANFEARPNVTVDMASQSLRSRNAVVLRTGSAALQTAGALVDEAVGPALAECGLPADAVALLRDPRRESAVALVRHPEAIPVVILRGSGESTRALAREAALAGVRALAHADGGGVLYVHPSADPDRVTALIDTGLDRLGVCNRLNLLVLDASVSDEWLPRVRDQLAGHDPAIRLSEPPHDHPLGWEWALDDAHSDTVTVATADGPVEAAELANRETSGLAATIAADDPAAALAFLGAYAGTGGFVNTSTRLLDGYRLLGLPETGINVDAAPGPRGPVTFQDLYLRQYVAGPAGLMASFVDR